MRADIRAALVLLAIATSLSFNIFVHACPLWDPDCKDLAPESECCGGGGGGEAAPSAEAPSAPPAEAAPPAPQDGPPSTTVDIADGGVAIEQATSVFVEPHDYPPREYGAYGIVAFPSAPTSNTRSRFIRVCEAYVATLPPAATATVPLDRQMVTVWPVSTPELAKKLSELTDVLARKNGCPEAVDHYDIQTAITAVRESGSRRPGNGPFLLAWSPASTKGKKDALVLVADLSNLEADEEFLARFRRWRDDIETKPDIFKDHWTLDRLVATIQNWADHWGNIFLSRGEPS
jgi:hypothetical protein